MIPLYANPGNGPISSDPAPAGLSRRLLVFTLQLQAAVVRIQEP